MALHHCSGCASSGCVPSLFGDDPHAFGVVRALLDPAVRTVPRDGAARLAAPVLDAAGTGGVPTFATLHGVYWLLADLADHQPLLLTADDAHWADTVSLQALTHLARRIADLPMLLVVTARPAEPAGVAAELLDALRNEPATIVLRPGPLSVGATTALIRGALGDPVDAGLALACHEVAEGNPLLLGALHRSLRDAGVAPTADGVAAVRARAPEIVAAFVLPLLRQLPAPAVAVARALAVLGPGAPLRARRRPRRSRARGRRAGRGPARGRRAGGAGDGAVATNGHRTRVRAPAVRPGHRREPDHRAAAHRPPACRCRAGGRRRARRRRWPPTCCTSNRCATPRWSRI